MAQQQSGVDSTLLTIDPDSGAARVTLYNSAGVELNPALTGVYMLPVNIRFDAALTAAAGAFVWALRVSVSATKDIYIRRIRLRAAFDGTEAASSEVYQLIKFTAATPTGGVALSAIELDSAFPATNVADARQTVSSTSVLLTTTSVVVDTNGHFAALIQARRNGSNGELLLDFHSPNDPYGCLKLGQGDGFAIRINTNTVIGDSLSGFVEWHER